MALNNDKINKIDKLFGKKLRMTQIFNDQLQVVPVTIIQAGPCVVTQVKTAASDGYDALQVGFEEKRRGTRKPQLGHYKKAKVAPMRRLREIRLAGPPEHKPGDVIDVRVFEGAKWVDIQGVSKGRGFTGVFKRHDFKGYPATHGAKDKHRLPGSIGSSAFPSRVMKGMRMAGHYGAENVTQRNLEVVRVDSARNLLFVKGAVPGPSGGDLVIHWAVKNK